MTELGWRPKGEPARVASPADDQAGRPPGQGQALDAGQVLDPGQVLDQLGDAVVVADADGRIRFLNQYALRLLGWTSPELIGQPVSTLVPPRFGAAHEEGFSRFVATGAGRVISGPPLVVAARHRDGTEIPVELSLGSLGPPGGPVTAVVATIRDIRDRLVVERRAVSSRTLQASVDASHDGVLAVSPQRKVLAVNRRFCELWHLEADSIQPGQDSPALLSESRSQIIDPDAFEAAIRWGHDHPSETQTLEVALKDGRVLEGYSAPLTDQDDVYLGRVWYLHDDTERRAVEAERAALTERLAAVQRSQRFLLDASEVLSRVSGFAGTLRSLAAVAVPTLGDLCLIDVIGEAGGIRRMAAVHADKSRQPLADRLYRYPPSSEGDHPSIRTMRERSSRYSAEMTDQFLHTTSRDEEHFQLLKELSFDSYMTVPLVLDADVLGTVTLVSAGSGRRFGPADLSLAEDLAFRVAGVVEKERRYEGQRGVSHTLQASLLPSDAPVLPPGFDAAVRYLPGTLDAELGGDFWDVSILPDGVLALAIGDVAGHDIEAAATMAQLRSACRALRPHVSQPAELVDLIQATWDQLNLELMATAVFARFLPATETLQMATAGHPPPLLVQAGTAAFLPLTPASPLGSPPNRAGLWEGEWPPGSTLVFYTDGLVEDRHRHLASGLERLRSATILAPSLEPDELADHILAELSVTEREDDVALLVVRRTPTTSTRERP